MRPGPGLVCDKGPRFLLQINLNDIRTVTRKVKSDENHDSQNSDHRRNRPGEP